MGNHHTTLIAVLQTLPAWIGLFIGHVIDGITLSNIAFVASIVYSVVHTYVTLTRARRERNGDA